MSTRAISERTGWDAESDGLRGARHLLGDMGGSFCQKSDTRPKGVVFQQGTVCEKAITKTAPESGALQLTIQ
ncbi:MAG: hypothetical protein OHK0015_46950 [Chloroflexi bacterium OHK40]